MIGLLLALAATSVIGGLMWYVETSPRVQCLLWGHKKYLAIQDHGEFKYYCSCCKAEVKGDE